MRKLLMVAGGLLVLGAGSAVGFHYAARPVSPEASVDIRLVKYQVAGTAMEPTLQEGDWLVAHRDARQTPKVGDLVVMKDPHDPAKLYCRRVVGVSGDRVVMRYYSNVKIATLYSASGAEQSVFPSNIPPKGSAYTEYETTVEANSFYVVGDNAVPGGSYDSDEWGLLPRKDVVAVVESRLSPRPRTF